MRKMLSTALILGLSMGLMGCPPAKKTEGGTDATGTDATGTDTPAVDGDATSKPADGDAAAVTDTVDAVKTQAVDISHVKVGQKYHFHMNNSGMEMDQVWEVTAMGDAEIKYNLTTIMNGKALGDPTEVTWAVPVAVASDVKPDPNAPKVEMKEETVTIAGREWDCNVVEASGYTSWCPKMSFPSVVKTMKDGVVTNELTKIE